MPNTCTPHHQEVSARLTDTTRNTADRVSARHANIISTPVPTKRIHNVIEQLHRGVQDKLMTELIEWSLDNLHTEFGASDPGHLISTLRAKAQQSARDVRLTILFFLLNVDIHLKDRILELDPPNSRKLVRFMSDLRTHAVVQFCTDERQQIQHFMAHVYELYILA